MNIRHLILFLLVISTSIRSQQHERWRTYLASYNTTAVAEAENDVYAMADGALYGYGKNDNSVKMYTKLNGLSDSDIKLIRYNMDVHMLMVVYSNGNIDLMNRDGMYNLPYLKNAGNIQDKTPNEINFVGEKAYLSTHFGIVVIDMKKKEVFESYKLGMKVYSSCLRGEMIYASTERGLYTASTKDNLMDFNNWKQLPIHDADLDKKKIVRIGIFQDKLCLCIPGAGLYYRNDDGQIIPLVKQIYIEGMTIQGDRLLAHTGGDLYIYTSLESPAETVSPGDVKDVSALKNTNTYWIASGTKGLIGIRRKNANSFETIVSGLNIEGPKRNYNDLMFIKKGKLLIAGGTYTPTARGSRAVTLLSYENGKWTNFDEGAAAKAIGYDIRDFLDIAVDPDDANHYFVSSFGEGVIEIKDNAFVQLYNHKNTPLRPALETEQEHYVRVGGICFDKNKNLWMTNCSAPNGIVVRTVDGTWKSLFFKGVSNATFIGRIMITSKGHKWVNVPRGNTGILVFDDNGTQKEPSDDKSNFFGTLKNARGEALNLNNIYCMAEDLNGGIWLGTDQGPIICSAPENAIKDPKNFFGSMIVRPNDDGSNGLFLSSEQINAIAVDGGNRKWIGTGSSGIFLINPTGTETIEHFTADNSPLLSDNILSIAIDHKTGEVFIGTDKGIISYLGTATEARSNYSDVYAFPNPVRPDFDGSVTITGLMADSNIKITDLNGNLIYQTKSAGGQATWNGRSHNGRRVAAGIYLVLASTPQGAESVVTKIAVVQ